MESTLGITERLAVTGVSHIALHVSDLDASIAWYEAVVGLAQVRTGPGRFAQLAPESDAFNLFLIETDPAEVHEQFGHLAIALESMDVLRAWVVHLDRIDAPHTPIKENPFRPGVFSIDVFDPDRHEIELIFEP
jgi:catechol 2,3-dioxygenase-like lactoylglutathione lyase family enzyme